MLLAECKINQKNLCEFAKNGELEKLIYICGYLGENGKNTEYDLDIAGSHPNCIVDNYAIRHACANGHLLMVKYLMENWSHLIDISADDNFAIRCACYDGNIDLLVYLIAVCLREILDCGLDTYDINDIINLLVENECINEYYLLTNELKKRKNLFNCNEKIEEQIEKKRNLCAEIECHPGLIGGQMGKNCEEGFEKVVKLLEKI